MTDLDLDDLARRCPDCGGDRLLPGSFYERNRWRCLDCGAVATDHEETP